jgi:hypothetical protein
MNKNLILACLALAACAALAGPAIASATNDPQLTTNAGTLVPAGTSDVSLTQVGSTGVWNTEGTTKIVECTSGTGTGSIIKNSGGTIEGEITSLTIGGTGAKSATEPANECTGAFGNFSVTPTLPWCLRSTPTMKTDEMQTTGGKCPGGGKVKFIIVSTSFGECEYQSAGPILADFTTSPEDARATIRKTAAGSGLALIRGGFLCPASVILEGTRTMESEAGSPLFVS